MKYICSLSLFVVLAPSAWASDTVISVSPGAWQSRHLVTVAGQNVVDETKTQCISEDDANRRLSSLVSQAETEANCSISNLKHRPGHVSADLWCDIKELSGTAAGEVVAKYTRTTYEADATGEFGFFGGVLPVIAKSTGQRIGPCVKGD